MVLHLLLAFSKFDNIQILIEVILIIWFVIGLFKEKFQAQEIILIALYLVAIGISFLKNEFYVALLGGKVIGLGILSMLYFSKRHLNTNILSVVCIVNIFLILFYAITGVNLLQNMVDQAGGSWSGLSGRPLGLFMSSHTSAYISAIFLLYFLHRTPPLGLGAAFIYSTTSLFTLVAYLSQVLVTYLARHIWLFFYSLLVFSFCTVSILLINIGGSGERLLEVLTSPLSGLFAPDRIMGISVIFNQLFNVEVFIRIFTIFPSDYSLLLENWTDRFGNELMLFTYVQHAGVLLLAVYLWILRSKIRYFFIFSLVGLLHYGDITSPLIVCMLVTYSTLIQNQEKNSD
jgi:hypothetical protein